MSKHPGEEVLALWAGGELDGSVAPEVNRHLEACTECRGRAEEIRSVRELLQGAFAEPSEADLQQLRSGLERLLKKRQATRWCWSLASAAAGLVFVLVGVSHRSTPVPIVPERTVQLLTLTRPVHLALNIPDTKPVVKRRVLPSRAEQPAGLRAVNFVPGADGSIQLRLTTADPNVIILLPTTERTGEQ